MEAFQAKRIERSYTQKIDAAPSQVFPLLCPVKEYDWIDGWTCEMIYSKSGVAENDCVFKTNFPHEGGEEVWVVSRYEQDRAIEFVRVSQGLKASRLNIRLESDGNGGTTAVWTRTLTGLNAKGNEFVEKMTDDDFQDKMRTLERRLNHYLTTGKMWKEV